MFVVTSLKIQGLSSGTQYNLHSYGAYMHVRGTPMFTHCRLCGVTKVLYGSMDICINDVPDDQVSTNPILEISSEELEQAIALTEYFQGQRQAYE